MAVEYIGRLVRLNLGATEDEWKASIAMEEEAAESDQFTEVGGVALSNFLSGDSPAGSVLFFFFEHHDQKGKKDAGDGDGAGVGRVVGNGVGRGDGRCDGRGVGRVVGRYVGCGAGRGVGLGSRLLMMQLASEGDSQ